MPLMRGHHSFDGHFTQIPNAWIRDQRLSYKARGLLAELLSHREGFLVSRERLARNGQDGDRAVRSAIGELEALGYLSRSQTRTDDNRFGAALWITSDPIPADNFPSVRFAPAGNAPAQNAGAKKTSSKKTTEKNTSHQQVGGDFDVFWSIYPRHVGKPDARKAFEKLHADHWPEILAGVKRLAEDPYLPEPKFIPYASTWLNREGWTDDPYPPREKSKEEKDREYLARAAREKELNRIQNEQMRLDREQAEANAVAAPPCEHGLPLYKCVPCCRRLAEEETTSK